MKLFIATPMYNSQCAMEFHASVMGLYKKHTVRHEINEQIIGNESLITRARNNFITMFYTLRDKFDYLIWWDSDVGMNADYIDQLLSYGKDVIGAPVRIKTNTRKAFSLTPMFDEKGECIKEGNLLRVHYMATGMMIMSYKAVEALINDAKRRDDIYTNENNTLNIDTSDYIYQVFKDDINDKSLPYRKRVLLSEDYWVCKTFKELGFKMWVDETIPTSHTGSCRFTSSDKTNDIYEREMANLNFQIKELSAKIKGEVSL